jgi:hypothetical protein
MKRKTIFTSLWMGGFAAATFLFGLVTLAILAYSRITSLASLQYIERTLKLLFFSSPLIALFLGLRGALPGTKQIMPHHP